MPTELALAPASAAQPVQRTMVRDVNLHLKSMLQDFKLTRASDLPAHDAQAIRELLGRIPRPPSALHKLVSSQYLGQTSTAELSEMVIVEPQVATKVLVVVN